MPPLKMAASADLEQDTTENVEKKIPITLLSGFLGAGKTTLLQQMLDNKGGLKVGVVVNDMAAVNVDSKLVKNSVSKKADDVAANNKLSGLLGQMDVSDVVEMQNGCACCSASDELLQSVLKLLVVAAEKGDSYDRIVIEMSGVGEPKNVRKSFFEMKYNEHPVFDYADLQNMVTVVDSANFLSMYESITAVKDRKDLVEESEAENPVNRKVVDLLTEQVEVADYVLLNKQDMVDAAQKSKLESVVRALNPIANVVGCEFGKVDLAVVLGSERESWVAQNDDEDDFRAVMKVLKESKADGTCTDPDCNDPTHSHEEAHKHSHSHEEAHKHSHSHEEDCHDLSCTDASHKHADTHAHTHAETHAHTHEADCHDPTCNDPSHSHALDEVCTDADCTDLSHAHAHTHTHEATPAEKFGITSFVYARRRPFNPNRLKDVIVQLPVTANSERDAGEWSIPGMRKDAVAAKTPMYNVIRSKGFVWLSNYHRTALYWSHAGKFFDLKEFGMFWAATPLDYWPQTPNELNEIVGDFGSKGTQWGDRRQEVVFIGVDMDREKIEALLDECLCTDEEMEEYKEIASNERPDRVMIDYTTTPPRAVPGDNAILVK